MAKIAILGSGGFGTALAITARRQGHNVILWSAFQSEVDEILLHSENRRYLPGMPVDQTIHITSNISDVKDSDIIIFAVPSFAVRETAKKVCPYAGTSVLINVAKGFEPETLERLSQVIQQEIPDNNFAVISGPSHAEEIARIVPTTVVAASNNKASALLVQNTLSSDTLRIYINNDVIGVEVGGALKNIIALCAGICDGHNMGDNTKAALMTRGMSEIARLGAAMGGKKETFAGLAGMGDLIVTCTSMHSRNRRAGILIGQGIPPSTAIKQIGATVEGYACTQIAHELAQKYYIQMPITEQLYRILYENVSVNDALKNLMQRSKKDEHEVTWIN